MTDILARLAQYRANLFLHASECFKVRDKGENIVPLIFNEAQRYVHSCIEAQKLEKGWIRALVLKGRQQGISTYVAARYYSRTSLKKGVNTYILTHEQPASDNLFAMVDRYQRHNPLRPHVGNDNVKELEFDLLESSYVVATAGQKAGGRGRSVSLFHGSEVAFWPNAKDHFAASVQAVPLMPGTEVILESTANGPTGEFYEKWQKAEAGIGDYIAIFVPWFVSPEYARQPEPGFELDNTPIEGGMSEVEYAEAYGLSLAQMCWRRAKIIELGSEETFRQEYPADAADAWITAGHNPFIKTILVIRARKRKRDGIGPLIIGVDPAGEGADKFVAAGRRTLKVEFVKARNKLTAQEGILWCKSLIDELDPARMNIDTGGGGNGPAIVSGLKLLGPKYVTIVRGVNFGSTAQCKIAMPKTPGPANRRAEMWKRSREWLELEEGVELPDMAVLQSDAAAPKVKPKLNGDFILESKMDMKARGIRSPDYWDAIALTFAQDEHFENYSQPKAAAQFGSSHLDTSPEGVITLADAEEISGGGDHGWMG